MKMNIKGLIFVGFAAAVFAGAANATDGTTGQGDKIVTSKHYVDTKYIAGTGITMDENDQGKKVISVNSEAGDLQEYTGEGLIDVTDHVISTSAQQNVIEGISIGGTAQIPTNKVVALGAAAGKAVETTISSTATDNTDDELATAKAVYDYVEALPGSEAYTAGTHVASIVDHKINVEGDGTIASGNDHLVTGGTVYTAVDARVPKQIGSADDNGKVLTVDNQGQVALSAADTYQKKLTTGNFVSIDPSTNTITTTYSAGTNVSISDAGQISATDTTYSADGVTIEKDESNQFSAKTGAITSSATTLVDGQTVYNYVTTMGNVLPANPTGADACSLDNPCALVWNGVDPVEWKRIAQ